MVVVGVTVDDDGDTLIRDDHYHNVNEVHTHMYVP
jgi:hypothetical protein